MLVGVVDLHVGRFADLHVGQSGNWTWDWNWSEATKQKGLGFSLYFSFHTSAEETVVSVELVNFSDGKLYFSFQNSAEETTVSVELVNFSRGIPQV